MSIEHLPRAPRRLLHPAGLALVSALALASALAGCAQPSDKSQADRGTGAGLARLDARGTPLPPSCLAPPDSDTPDLLPPGCATQLNLQLMVERPADLQQGRPLGPSMAAPVANAVERYVRPDDDPEQRRRVEKESVISSANVQ
jgi:type IV pilus biogenesis protein CpaD/CtpE